MGYSFLLLCMVLYSGITWCDAECQELLEKGVDETDSNTALGAQNYVRRIVSEGQVPGQPQATNLEPLQWDDELARQAQEVADQCIVAHSTTGDVGQNIFWTGSSEKTLGADWLSAVQSWFNEVEQYNYPTSFTPETGHYTQLVSARSKFVGCGYSQYYEDGFYQKLYVCNYSPAGNFNGQPPYAV